jgi:hypothetical protein
MIHLIEYVDQSTESLWLAIENAVSEYPPFIAWHLIGSKMNDVLRPLKWPSVVQLPSPPDVLEKLKSIFQEATVIEQIVDFTQDLSQTTGSSQILPLLSFKALTKEIGVHFRYHFEGNRSTNNIERVSQYCIHC